MSDNRGCPLVLCSKLRVHAKRPNLAASAQLATWRPADFLPRSRVEGAHDSDDANGAAGGYVGE
jgi:hypothetical protein